jgi:acyl-CoA thioester hydrolase
MNPYKFEYRVRYADTDHSGVVYHANYFKWMEAARIEQMRGAGILYSDYEKKGFFLPVVHAQIDYKDSAEYDDLIIVEVKIEKIGNSSIHYKYKIYRKEDEHVFTEAVTVNVMITKDKKPVRVQDEIREIIRNKD